MSVNWFENIFLPSLTEKALNNSNPKYANSTLLSEKQYGICVENFSQHNCYGDYGSFSNFEYFTEMYKYQICTYGKYHILYVEKNNKRII